MTNSSRTAPPAAPAPLCADQGPRTTLPRTPTAPGQSCPAGPVPWPHPAPQHAAQLALRMLLRGGATLLGRPLPPSPAAAAAAEAAAAVVAAAAAQNRPSTSLMYSQHSIIPQPQQSGGSRGDLVAAGRVLWFKQLGAQCYSPQCHSLQQ